MPTPKHILNFFENNFSVDIKKNWVNSMIGQKKLYLWRSCLTVSKMIFENIWICSLTTELVYLAIRKM